MEKILSVVDKIAPFRDQRIKNNTQDWFNDKVAEAIKLRENRLKQFKSTKLHTDEDLYKEAKYHSLKKKPNFTKKNFKKKQSNGKTKEIMATSEIFRLTLKKVSISNICLKKDYKICFDDKTNPTVFKELVCNYLKI